MIKAKYATTVNRCTALWRADRPYVAAGAEFLASLAAQSPPALAR